MRGQDVDEMLDGMTSEQFDEYVAMDEVLPFGDEKICVVFATGISLLISRFNRLIKAWNGEENPEVKPNDLLPWKKKKRKKKRPEYVSPNAGVAAFKLAVNR